MPFRPPIEAFNIPQQPDLSTPEGQFAFQQQNREQLGALLANQETRANRPDFVNSASDLLGRILNAPGSNALMGGPMAAIGPIRGLLTSGAKELGKSLKGSLITNQVRVPFGGAIVRFGKSTKLPKPNELENIINNRFPEIRATVEARRGGLGGARGDTSFHVNLRKASGSSVSEELERKVFDTIFGKQ